MKVHTFEITDQTNAQNSFTGKQNHTLCLLAGKVSAKSFMNGEWLHAYYLHITEIVAVAVVKGLS